MNKINNLCKIILQLLDSDFEEAEKIAQGQIDYNHPFKMATAKWQGELGEYNMKVIKAIKALRELLKTGEAINNMDPNN